MIGYFGSVYWTPANRRNSITGVKNDGSWKLVESLKRAKHRIENGYLTPGGEHVWGGFTIIAIPGELAEDGFLLGVFDIPVAGRIEGVDPDTGPPVELSRSEKSGIVDFTQWKIDRGLICEN